MVAKKMDKRMEAKSATLLKYMLEMELRRLRKAADIDILLFMGIDSRVFSSYIPTQLSPTEFYLLNLFKANMASICSTLHSENLIVSIQHYKEGTMIISGVGDNAFLTALIAKEIDNDKTNNVVKQVENASIVLKHIFELKPTSQEAIAAYPPEIQEELNKLSRQLFVEQFDQTRGYKKNMDILEYVKKKIATVAGVGNVEEIVTVTFNELGTSAPYMTDQLWMIFVEKVIKEHIARLNGDIVADECIKSWLPEVEKKIKSFV